MKKYRYEDFNEFDLCDMLNFLKCKIKLKEIKDNGLVEEIQDYLKEQENDYDNHEGGCINDECNIFMERAINLLNDENNQSKLDEAKQLIDEFCENEYGSGADFTDLQNIDVAYTTTEDNKAIQVTLDLINLELRQYVNSELYDKIIYSSLEDMIDKDLKHLDFDELVRL